MRLMCSQPSGDKWTSRRSALQHPLVVLGVDAHGEPTGACRKTPLVWFPYGRPFRQGLPRIFRGFLKAVQTPGGHCRKSYDSRHPGFHDAPSATHRIWRTSAAFTPHPSYFVCLCYKKVPFVRWGQSDAGGRMPEIYSSPTGHRIAARSWRQIAHLPGSAPTPGLCLRPRGLRLSRTRFSLYAILATSGRDERSGTESKVERAGSEE
jgi:hypothetical protein